MVTRGPLAGQGVLALALAAFTAFGPGETRAEPLPAGPSGTELSVGAPVTVTLAENGSLFVINAGPGDYLAGEIAGQEGPVTADLLFPDGRHFRRIAEGAEGATRFQVVAESDGLLLRLSGSGAVQLRLDSRVTPAAQLPAPVSYLSPRIAGLAQELAVGGNSAAFWQQVAAQGTPLVETSEGGQVMTFLWRGTGRNVRLIGGPSNDHTWLERLGESDVWFASFVVPPGTRLAYQLAPDVPDIPGTARARRGALMATAQVDPLNLAPVPADAPDRFGQEATVTLPDAPDQPGTPPAPDADPLVTSFPFDSARLGNSRRITISQPRGLDPADPQIVLLFLFDGEKALSEIHAPQMLETLTRAGRLPPVVAVLIPSIDTATRSRELPGNADFADMLAAELLPEVLARSGIRHDPARTVLAGASYGGLASATVAMRHPEAFGNAITMSGSFWWAPEGAGTDGTPWVAAQIAANPVLPVRFFLSAGSFETGRDDSGGILETSRILRDTLRLKGNTALWREYAGGHDYVIWRGALADGLIALFGR